jgi:O-antigen/teichoic acid export membrane protein
MRNVAARSVFWSTFESGSVSLFSFASVIILIRILGPEQFGTAVLALSIVQVIGLACGQLFHDVIVQRRTLDGSHMDSAWWTSLLIGVGAFAALGLSRNTIAALLDVPDLGPILVWMAAPMSISGATNVLVAGMRRDLRYQELAQCSAASRLFGTILAIAGALTGFGLWSFVFQQWGYAVSYAALIFARSGQRPELRISFQALKELMPLSGPMFLSYVLWFGSQRIFMILTGYTLDATAIGYLSMAFRLVETARDMLAGIVVNPAYSIFSRQQDDPSALRRSFHAAAEYTGAVTQPLFVGLIVCAPEVALLLFGAEAGPTVMLIQILAALTVVDFARLYVDVILNAVGRPWLKVLMFVAGLAVIGVGLALYGDHGIIAATLVWAARMVVMIPLGFWLVRRAADIGILDQCRSIAVPTAVSLLMGASLMALRSTLPVMWAPLLTLAVLATAGTILYAALLLMLKPSLVQTSLRFFITSVGRKAAKNP